jgi:protein-L-isoaspartate(D-aspartate) O-methyltransferase
VSAPEDDDRRRRYLAEVRRDGAPLDATLAAAFAAVPREAFVADGFHGRDGVWVRPGGRAFLDAVYRDDVLVTKLNGTTPVSSSSQPSLMALMLAALDVRPGMRVLEIGAGTGYNAALLAALGAEVTSVDVQIDVADRARTALAGAGITGATVVHGDGYLGAPGWFDRVIVTVGVAGVSPHWLGRLDRDGLVVVPVEHAGTHPVLVVRGTADGPVTAVPVCPAGFMSAAGPLTAPHAGAHPLPAAARTLPGFTEVARRRWSRPLSSRAYRDLWYATGVWHRRATYAALPGFDHGCLALIDDARTGGAAILPDGTVLAGGPYAERFAADAAAVLDRWSAEGGPPMTTWRITLASTGLAESPIWVPARWDLEN